MPYRIAVLAACPFPARRGTPLRIERLTEALIERGHDVEVISYHLCDSPARGDYPVHRIYGRADVEPLGPGPTWRKLAFYDPALVRLARRVLRGKSFDLIHAHHYEGLIAARLASRGMKVPIVYDAHTMLHSELPSYAPRVLAAPVRMLGNWLDRVIPAMADHVLTVTEDLRQRLVDRHGMRHDSVDVAMNGVEFEHFSTGAEREPEAPGRVIYTGTLAGYQGFDLLLDAFALALKERPDMRLTVAASSPFDPFEDHARELGIRGAIDLEADSFAKLPERLATSAIAVLPRGECDGIPQKLLNYMAAGKAIVACEGSAKLLEDGENGLVVANGDKRAFADALVRLHDDRSLAARLGSAARVHVVANCSWDRTAQICEVAYRRLATGSRAARAPRAPHQQRSSHSWSEGDDERRRAVT
ncbi:MAG: glycosyltransferase family 4 protein [Geminicoccaceae bacterium]|nr:glycosyltransferase family 4 protein [Geminicoccaceae bacterium]